MASDPKNAEQMIPVKDISAEANALAASQTPAKMDAIDECFQKWLVQNVYNSPLSRDTEAFNYLQERLALLRDALRQLKQ
jgi:glutathionylspermidine synthase